MQNSEASVCRIRSERVRHERSRCFFLFGLSGFRNGIPIR